MNQVARSEYDSNERLDSSRRTATNFRCVYQDDGNGNSSLQYNQPVSKLT